MLLNGVSSPSDVIVWEESFDTQTLLLADVDYVAWNLYQEGGLRPQYVVIDREMVIRYKGSEREGMEEAEVVIRNMWTSEHPY